MATSSGGNHSEHDVVDAGFEPVFEAEDIGPYVDQISPGHQTFGNGVAGNLDDGLGVIVEACGGVCPWLRGCRRRSPPWAQNGRSHRARYPGIFLTVPPRSHSLCGY